MNKFLRNIAILVGVAAITALTASGQPANDNFANAWTLSGSAATTNGNSGQTQIGIANATKEAGEPNHAGFPGGRSVWFNWTAPTNVTVRIDTIGSGFNTLLAVYTGNAVSALTLVAQNDDVGGAGQQATRSRVEFPATAGTRYRIAIDGRGGFNGQNPASGPYVLNVLSLASVFVTSPTNGAIVAAGTPMTIDVAATVPAPPVTRVDFYRSGTLIGSDSNAPYSLVVPSPPPGTNSLRAVAVDNAGLSWTSAVVNVAVLSVGVTIVSPPDGTVYSTQVPITVNALGLLPAGSITNVEFFVDGQKFGEDGTSPFSAVWGTVTGGAHRLTAIGRSDSGATYNSLPVNIAVAQFLIVSNSVWKYLDNGSDQGTSWTALNFDDSSWSNGPAQLGYGDGDEATVVSFGPDPNNKYITTYFRHALVVTNATGYETLNINVQRDDGAVVYVNGVEAARYNMNAGPVLFSTLAPNDNADGVGFFSGTAPASLLVEGTNVLAVEIHQTSLNSSDISFNLEMLATPRIVRNQSPSVALTNPTNSSSFLAPSAITLEANASDADGSVTKVEFFANGSKLGEDTDSPYTFLWSNPPLGEHVLTAVATDDQDASAQSASIAIAVYDSAGRPLVRIIAPANGAIMEGPTNLTITANAGAITGVTNVEFYAGTTLIGTSAGSGTRGLRADYQFQNTLNSSAGAAPALANLGGNTFGTATVDGASRTVLRFAQNDGLVLNQASTVIPSNSYSAVMLFSFTDVTSWRRIIDFKNAATDNGLYSYNTSLNLYPTAIGPANAIPANTFVQVALTRDSSSNVVGYVNGLEQFSLVDVADDTGLDTNDVLRFFRDNGTEGSAGAVARLRLYDVPLLAGEIAALDRLPGAGPASTFSVVWNAPFGTSALTAVATDGNGLRGTSAVVTVTITIPPTNTVPPTIATQNPPANSAVTNLTSIQVTFSERVFNVSAGDLLINGNPAISVTGSGSNYTFTVTQPAFGAVNITWAAGHGITDFGYPSSLPFDANGPGATWSYNLIDRTPPVITTRNPAAGATVISLTQVSVTFSEDVNGVEAADFLVNGTPAFGFTGSGSNYTFSFSQPGSGTVNITWAGGHGISDTAPSPNPFNATAAGATWSYTLDARTILVQSNANWQFIKGIAEASTPVDAWRQPGFDDSGWSNALAPFYYGDPYGTAANPGTLLSDMQGGGYSSIYLRKAFVVANVSTLTNLLLNHQSDDGFIAWVNGVEVLRYNMGAGEIPYNGSAQTAITESPGGGAPYTSVSLPDPAGYIVEGTNVLAVHAFNNQPQTSSDFGFNAQLYTYLVDPSAVGPRIAGVTPPAGDVFYLTNVTVRFSEGVSGVNAADLLVNGVAATGVTSATNTTYTFSFAQPLFGPVSVTWGAGHGIADFDSPPKPFDQATPGSTFNYSLLNPSAPTVASQVPLAGANVNSLTQIIVTFSEGVAGVNAGDLLVSGVPAANVSGGPSVYTFTFPQPAYGPVSIGWATGHGIVDLEPAANAFDPLRSGSSWSYTLVDQTAPFITSKNPPAGTQVIDLTSLTVTFSEAVTGIGAADLLINGIPASGVTGGPTTYTFTFAQPNATVVNVTWANAHGIRDLAPVPNAFDATAPGATWSYTTLDNVAPTLVALSPPAGATVRALVQISVTFSEPVAGVGTNDLLINNRPATQVSGSGAGPYTFNFLSPSNGAVEVRWSGPADGGHGITDLAAPPNPFAGGEWTYTLDPNASFAGNIVISEIMFNPLGGKTTEEWIELHNVSANLVNLSGWRFTRGVDFTFPNVSIGPGGYLVVAANVAAFQTRNPGVTNVVGGWTGRLANSEENVELVTALGEMVNSVHYATEGDWARRERGHGAQPVTGATFNGTTATLTVFGHGFTGQDRVMISGASQPEYNGIFTIANVQPSTFNITVPGATAPATGMLIARQVIDDGASGWSWFTAADGFGSSLELVNASMPNSIGQNWLASATAGGTPGRANSVRSTNAAPFLLDVTHTPAVPRATDAVSITARVRDELSNGVASVTLYYRNHTAANPGAFASTNMFDDGAHGDGVAADGLFGAILPAQVNGTIIEFYAQAMDNLALTRTWPAPAWDTNNTFGQLANAYYQVDDEVIPDTMPAIRVIVSGTESAIYQGINRNSDAEQNITLVSQDGDGTKIRYLGGVRIRGAGSRTRNPPNNRVNLPNDNLWNGMSAINLNGQFVHAQLAGAAVARKAGLPASDAHVVQYRMNGVNPAPINAPVNGGGDGAGYGTFLFVQPVNGDLAEDLFPEDGDGNVYRASTGNHNADLSYRGADPSSYVSTARGYFKTSNQTENDWSDLMNLTFAFSQLNDAEFMESVKTNLNVLMWMRYFAVGSLVNFGETSLFNGRGDDYALYRGITDPRFVLIGHDFDTVFGQGDTLNGYAINTNSSPFIMMNPPFSTGGNTPNVPLIRRLMTNENYVPFFFSELVRLADSVFHPSQLGPLFDQLLGGWGPTTTTIDDMKTYAANRRANILAQIPLTLSVGHSLTTISNGLPYTTAPNVTLFGNSHAIDTRRVLVNGALATRSAWEARWTNTVTLRPGVNRVFVQSLDSNNVAFANATVDLWYDDGSVQSVSGALTTDTVWTAANGPYQITANLTVNPGVTLTVQPGTTVYLSSGVGITVANGGRILAEGTETARIRFTRAPGGGNWGGIVINGGAGSPETRIAYAHFEGNGSSAIDVNVGDLFLDHCTFGNTAVRYLDLDGASFVVQDCYFPNATAQFEPIHGTQGIKAGGRGIIQRCFVGRPIGYNDSIDFTGGNRPGPIIQVLDCVFTGSDDDILDFDSTDAWVEGNIFLHVHRNGSPDSASAISGGADNADTSQITAVGNLFYDVDQAANAKQGNFYTFINNTIVRQSRIGSQDTESGVITMADEGTALGLGFYLEGNIISDAERLVRTQGVAQVTFTNNLIHQLAGAPWSGSGGNNVTADPLFQYVPQFAETTNFTTFEAAQVMWSWFSLRPGSPATGIGPNGRDLGAVAPLPVGGKRVGVRGASISGEPVGSTPATSATLVVGLDRTGSGIPTAGFPNGSGFTHFRWRLDGGLWSAETPIAAPITLNNLGTGPHSVEVSGKNDAGFYQDDPVFGSSGGVTTSRAWTVNPNASPLRLSEILAANNGALNHAGTTPDVIELVNESDIAIDLAGVRLTDDPQSPDKFIFPPGANIPARGYLVVFANNPDGTLGYHTGFNLSQQGEGVYLYDSVANGGALLDSVTFGLQLTDLSVGRLADGSWALTQPTFGAANRAAPIGDLRGLRINEWLALGTSPFNNDFIELYNTGSLPVALGGLFLSDELVGNPARHEIAALSFIPGFGYLRFVADGDADAGADHVNFSLSGDQGEIGLFLPDLSAIDCVYYQPQRLNISEGRSPNGSSTIVFFDTPTPGAPNPLITTTPQGGALVINEVLANSAGLAESGRTPDWVELYNGTTNIVNLAGLSLTDDSLQPRRFVFAAGARLAPASRLRVLCDSELPAAANVAAFGLSASGGAVYLFDSLANGGSLLSSIIYGLQTPDLSIGRVPDGSTNWVLTTPTPDAANSAVPALGNVSNLRVNEWLADPEPGDDDWFEIYNPTALPVALGGLYLTDDLNNRTKHRIAPLSFLGTSTNGFQQFIADGNTGAGADHVGFSLRGAGEAVGISDTVGALINGYAFSAQVQGVSEGRFPDGTTNVVRFPATASPGASNWRWLADIAINEALTHSDLPLEDAIELRNLTAAPIDIGGWWLSDDNGTLRKYQLPSPTIVPANGFVVIYESAFSNDITAAIPFGLSSKGDDIVLAAATNGALTGYRTRVDFGAQFNGVSFGRHVTSDNRAEFVAMSARTFGQDDPSSVEDFRMGTGASNAYPRVGPVVISEIMYHPPDIGTNDNVIDEFIELRNITTVPVPLYDPAASTNVWRLRDAVDFDFPPNTTMAPGDYLLVVSFDPVANTNALAQFRSRYNVAAGTAVVGPYSGKLANDTDDLELRRPDSPNADEVPYVLVERVRYFDVTPWPAQADGSGFSLQRNDNTLFGNDPANWFAAAPTPGPQSSSGDSDGDGLPDLWETTNGFDPFNPADAALDPDGDRSNNSHEYQAGTNPRDAQSALRFIAVSLPPVGPTALVTFSAAPNRSYSVLWKESFTAGHWSKLADVAAGPTERNETVVDPLPPAPGRVYNVVTPQQAGPVNPMPAILSSPQPTSAQVDEIASFNVTAIGKGPLTYQWLFNGVPIPNANGSSHTLNNVQFGDVGLYSVTVSDGIGTETSGEVPLLVGPRITVQPLSQAVLAGRAATLSVTADGIGPLGYLWRRNGRSLVGQTQPALTIANFQARDAGTYSVVVTHDLPWGRFSVSSSNAVLSVAAPPGE